MNHLEVWLKASENCRNGSKNILNVGRNISILCSRGLKDTGAGRVFTHLSVHLLSDDYQVIWKLSGKSPQNVN